MLQSPGRNPKRWGCSVKGGAWGRCQPAVPKIWGSSAPHRHRVSPTGRGETEARGAPHVWGCVFPCMDVPGAVGHGAGGGAHVCGMCPRGHCRWGTPKGIWGVWVVPELGDMGMQGHGDGDIGLWGHGAIGIKGHGDRGTSGYGDEGTWGNRDTGSQGYGDVGPQGAGNGDMGTPGPGATGRWGHRGTRAQ